jgi:hypothetical protein
VVPCITVAKYLATVVQGTTDYDYLITALNYPNYDSYQWLRIQFLELLMMGTKSTRNM